MWLNIAAFTAGILLLYGGAEGLVRGSVSIARACSITPIVVGLTVVAFGTSMPELVVSVQAAIAGEGAIAVGNVVGSNIANIGLILGLSALLCPLAVHTRLIRVDVPVLVVISLAIALMLYDQGLGRGEGALLTLGLVLYVAVMVRGERRVSTADQSVDRSACEPPRSTLYAAALVAIGLALLVAGAQLLVTGATAIAAFSGVSEAVIGLTIVAVGTSLPELATSLLAAARRQGDIAVGNIVGSNIFNLLGILGVVSLVEPLRQTGMSLTDLGAMIGLTVLLLPLARSDWRVSRGEGMALLASYGIYIAHLLNR